MPQEKGPVINRSKIQLATSYAPGTLFTFEGGKGCFLSVPVMTRQYQSSIEPIVQRQIQEQVTEFISNWFNAGMNCRGTSGPPVYEQQVLSNDFLDHRRQPSFKISRFVLLDPMQVGYCPEPLSFSCRKCGLLSNYRDCDDFVLRHPAQQNRADCHESADKRHDWVQLDVVFAHWSGNYEALYPEAPCACGNNEFFLKKSATGVFSDWYFKCSREGCSARQEVTRREPKTRELLEEKIKQGAAHQRKEMNMLPVSYRASSLYYVQTDRFIPYPDASMFELFLPNRIQDLGERLLSLYNYPQRPLSDEQIKEALEQCGQGGAFAAYSKMKEVYAGMQRTGPAGSAEAIESMIKNMLSDWAGKGWVRMAQVVPDSLMVKIVERGTYARRYDPIRLGLEHDLLEKRHLCSMSERGAGTVNLLAPTPDIAPEGIENSESMENYRKRLQVALQRLGIGRLLLIRELDLIQYSFGYTRVSATPTTEQKNMAMPVRLCTFDHVEKHRRPIYILHQKNEAFYVQLDETAVIRWLSANGLAADIDLPDGLKFGARYIENYLDFGPYLEAYKRRDGVGQKTICNLTYLLLHTMAHQFIHIISEHSGLEYGSFGEYIFPADLAFIVYRSGMTPDLGNLSSMWRNFHVRVLDQILSANNLLCSSGSLCDHRGGACPGCIMLPETTCIAGNHLLSRAVLKGGPSPQWAMDKTALAGYFSVTRDYALKTDKQ